MSVASNSVLALSRTYYGKSLDREDFKRLCTCQSINEVASYLRTNTVYSHELLESGISDFSAGVLEDLIMKHRYNSFNKLGRFYLAAGSELYRLFSVKTEIEQILHCVLAILGNSSERYLMEMHGFLDRHLSLDLYALGRAQSLEQVAALLDSTQYRDTFRGCLKNEKKDFLVFENAFRGYYQRFAAGLAKKNCRKKEREELLSALSVQFDTELIERLWRTVKYYSHSIEEIKPCESVLLSRFFESQLASLNNVRTPAELEAVLEKSPYKAVLNSTESHRLDEGAVGFLHDYCKKQIRFSVFPSVVMFCYGLLSQDEVKNLVRVIEGIRYGFSAEEIEKSLFSV